MDPMTRKKAILNVLHSPVKDLSFKHASVMTGTGQPGSITETTGGFALV